MNTYPLQELRALINRLAPMFGHPTGFSFKPGFQEHVQIVRKRVHLLKFIQKHTNSKGVVHSLAQFRDFVNASAGYENFSITSNAAASITDTSASVTGILVNGAMSKLTKKGFVLMADQGQGYTGANLAIGDAGAINVELTLNDSFTTVVGDLVPETTYFFKAYGINPLKTEYSAVRSFTTLAAQLP